MALQGVDSKRRLLSETPSISAVTLSAATLNSTLKSPVTSRSHPAARVSEVLEEEVLVRAEVAEEEELLMEAATSALKVL